MSTHEGVWRRVWNEFDHNTRDTLYLVPADAHLDPDGRMHVLVGDLDDVHKVVLVYDEARDAFTVTVGKPNYKAPHWTVEAEESGVDIDALRDTTLRLCKQAGAA